jgi:hypothetical protein
LNWWFWGKHIPTAETTYIVGSNGASRVSRDKLELHIYLSKKKLVPGLESWARGLVEWEAKKVTVVKHLPSAISPCDVKVLVQVSSCESHERAKKGKSQKRKWSTWASRRSHGKWYQISRELWKWRDGCGSKNLFGTYIVLNKWRDENKVEERHGKVQSAKLYTVAGTYKRRIK